MNPKRVRKSEQAELSIECKRSGFSDYQWCKSRGFTPELSTTGQVNSAKQGIRFLIPKAEPLHSLSNRKW